MSLTDTLHGLSGDDDGLFDDGRAVHRIEYHLLLVTRRRRPLFADETLRRRCHELMTAVCEELGCHVECLTVHPSTVTVHAFVPPALSAHRLAYKLLEVAAPLKAEFPEIVRKHGAIFIRRYMATTTATPETACDAFVERIPKR